MSGPGRVRGTNDWRLRFQVLSYEVNDDIQGGILEEDEDRLWNEVHRYRMTPT